VSPDLLEGALIAVGAFLAGQWLPRPHRRGVKASGSPELICGCTHHHSFHDPKTGECHGTTRKVKYGTTGAHLGLHDFPCTCRTYTGPVPLPEYVAQELGG
jgi:hypothetical protein